MALDKTGKWWTGSGFADLDEYLRLLGAAGYPVEHVARSVCRCENATFRLRADRIEGCAQRICVACDDCAFICDSHEPWDTSRPSKVRCRCKHDVFELGVGFSMRPGNPDEVRWITVGQRCINCGTLGSAVNWKIDYSPSQQLLGQA